MAAAHKIDIKNRLLSGQCALGNSGRGLKEVCSDLVNQYREQGGKTKDLVDGTFLTSSTLDRMGKLSEAESGVEYRPNADTCERILKFFGAEMTFDQVRIKAKHLNKPKI